MMVCGIEFEEMTQIGPNLITPQTAEDAARLFSVLEKLNLQDIKVHEWWAITDVVPDWESDMALDTTATRFDMHDEAIRNLPGNERLKALYKLRQSIGSHGLSGASQ